MVKPVHLSITVFILILLLVMTSFPNPIHGCDAETGNKIYLPSPLSQTSAAALEGKIYIFGGMSPSGMNDQILVFNPLNNNITILDVRLPSPLSNPNAFTDGKRIFIVGGEQPGTKNLSSNLTIFTLPNNIENHPNFFPYGLEGVSVAYSGSHFYLFGNYMSNTNKSRNVLRFDPESLGIKIYENVLPMEITDAGAVWYKGSAYIFGGMTEGGVILDTVLKYTPEKDISTLTVHLPAPRTKMGVASIGDMAFLLGGVIAQGFTDTILSFDLQTLTCEEIYHTLCSAKSCRACVTIGDKAYLIGGVISTGPAKGIEDIILPTPGKKINSNEGLSWGDWVLLMGIGGSLAIIVIVIIVLYSRRSKNEETDNAASKRTENVIGKR